jgi:hypothetical protein
VVVWFAAALAIALRAPALWSHPSFWAEEGAIYFAAAFNQPWYDSLFAPHVGYYSLFANGVALIAARFAPLEYAPFVTLTAALAVQALPVALILLSRAPLWRSWASALTGTVIVIFLPTSSGELWLNTINSQFHLALCTFLVLLEEPADTPGRRFAHRAVLLLGGLTGAVSCFLTPLFVLRYWLHRHREHLVQAALMAVCTLVQLLALWSQADDPSVARRFSQLDLPTLGALLPTLGALLWTNTIAWPFLGFGTAHTFATVVYLARNAGSREFTDLGVLLLAADAIFLWWLARALVANRACFLLGSFLSLVVLSALTSVGSMADKWGLILPGFAGRYFYAPVATLLITVLSGLVEGRPGLAAPRRVLHVALLVCAIAVGVSQFRVAVLLGPPWYIEVARWRENPQAPLAIAPRGWTVLLRP